MQYCPACERPVRDFTGNCPHCGKPLGGPASAAPPAASTPAPAAPSLPSASPAGPASAERELALADDGTAAPATAARPAVTWEDESSGDGAALDLAFDPGAAAPAVRPAAGARKAPGEGRAVAGFLSAAEPDAPAPEEVERVAGFARPGNYVLAPLYALRVLRRLGPLRRELAARRDEEARAVRLRRETYAQWARAHGREMAADPAMKPAIDAVLEANRMLQGFLAARQADFERFRREDGALAEQERAAEAERAKRMEELAARELTLRERSDATARAKAKERRAEIEWRNLERLAQGDVGPSSPHAARAAELQQARAAAAGELAQAQAEERAAREEVERVRAGIAELDRQLEARRAQIRSDPARRRLEEDHDERRRAVEDALARATAQALARKVLAPDSPDGRRLQALDAAEDLAVRARRLAEAAVARIDRTMVAVGLAIPLAALALLVVLLAVLR
ncbi:MAG: hypothetical protein GYA57_17415 [Myxococcales bacterium]|nr:hypothetical protein [Myxococcales bacterium]